MLKSIAVFLLAAVAAIQWSTALAGPVTAPTGLNLGDQYRLAFVTSNSTTATSSDINYYNAFVSGAASSSPQLAALGTTWQAIAETPGNNAAANIDITSPDHPGGYPVYNLAGQFVVPETSYLALSNLWNYLLEAPRLSAPIDVTEAGAVLSASVWTGTNEASGGGWGNEPLGGTDSLGSYSNIGISTSMSSGWSNYLLDLQTNSHPMYGISGVLTNHTITAAGGTSIVGGAAATFDHYTSVGSLTSNYIEAHSLDELQQFVGTNLAFQAGGILQAWDLGFTGTFTGQVHVTLHYDPAMLNGTPESSLVLWHFVNGTSWEKVANEVIDTNAHTISFDTSSFSPFVLAPVPEPASVVLGMFAVAGLAIVAIRRRRAR